MARCRRLLYDDLSWIVEELRELPTQSRQYADVPDDPQYVWQYFAEMYNAGTLVGIVSEYHKSFILSYIGKPWWANRVECNEMILWVPAEFRGGSIAYRLIGEWLNLIGNAYGNVSIIRAGASLDITDNEHTLRLYEKHGFTRRGNGVEMRL
ncbi:acyltransferase [Rhizobium phage Palo]|uniref:Acyltransferase n=1 Tax=Rhizobium phage Palo TaxID=2767573 RepID=A0A7L8G4K5_9CAUD|nr:acyltransferase [Rhizobium phage Palo]